jgi:hypothetical protein
MHSSLLTSNVTPTDNINKLNMYNTLQTQLDPQPNIKNNTGSTKKF